MSKSLVEPCTFVVLGMMVRQACVPLDQRVSAITSHIVRRLADATVEDMRARYDFGRVLQTLRSRGRGAAGTGILRGIADRLRVDPSALRRYAHVSEAISPLEFAWMTDLTSARGVPLTWSHVELLARVSDAERRRQLALATVEQDLSVRDLSVLVRGGQR
jgi:hypothetical protein